jgi:arabinose-5-phosphate isomerase
VTSKRQATASLGKRARAERSPVIDDALSVIRAEGAAVLGLAERLDQSFCDAVECMLACRGRVVVTGLGKSGIVGQKISATLASTGTPSLFLHAAEAVHGDLGRITPDDVVVALSNSGNSEEVVRLIRPIKDLGAPLIAITGSPSSPLAKHADIALLIGNIAEACPMGLVPTASTTAMMVLGDALAVGLFNRRGFGREDYARFHPGGALGRQLLKVREVMRHGAENPVVAFGVSLKEAIAVMSDTPGRPGAVSIVDAEGRLAGFFTDGDLRRLLLHGTYSAETPVAAVMHQKPKQVHCEQLVAEATRILRDFKIDQVPVVDDDGAPVGLLDVQDLLSTREPDPG